MMREDKVLSNVRRAEPNDVADVDMLSACVYRAPTQLPWGKQRPERTLIFVLIDFLKWDMRSVTRMKALGTLHQERQCTASPRSPRGTPREYAVMEAITSMSQTFEEEHSEGLTSYGLMDGHCQRS